MVICAVLKCDIQSGRDRDIKEIFLITHQGEKVLELSGWRQAARMASENKEKESKT